jgi:hypothetical protein
VVPASQFVRNLQLARQEMDESVKGLETKLNKSLVVLSEEIDGLKEPLHDIIQDIDKERVAMNRELERTKYTNR